MRDVQHVDGFHVTTETRKGSVAFTFLAGTAKKHQEIGQLEVVYRRGRNKRWQVKAVRLELDENITPSALQRFSWGKWLALADSLVHRPPPTDLMNFDNWDADVKKQLAATLRHVRGLPNKKRPGRRGHTEDFYEGVAARVRALEAAGVRNYVKTLADELEENYQTVARWIRKCRPPDRDLLPPARQGR